MSKTKRAQGEASDTSRSLEALRAAIFGIGLLDDAAVVAFVLRAVKTRLDAFMDWETTRVR